MIVRLYTGDDGKSHLEELNMPVEEVDSLPLQEGANVIFRRSAEGKFSDWHNAPRRQFVITLAGGMEIGLGDGTLRRFGPGDVVLAEDLTGQGHTTRSVGNRVLATIPLRD